MPRLCLVEPIVLHDDQKSQLLSLVKSLSAPRIGAARAETIAPVSDNALVKPTPVAA